MLVNSSLGDTEKMNKAFSRRVQIGFRFLQIYFVLCISLLENLATTNGSLDVISDQENCWYDTRVHV